MVTTPGPEGCRVDGHALDRPGERRHPVAQLPALEDRADVELLGY